MSRPSKEVQELMKDLNDKDFSTKKEAMKKGSHLFYTVVIAISTVGKDVSYVFHSVLKLLEYNDLELKKLVYLYVINNSKQKQDDAIMVVSFFKNDIQNKTNALIRGLAVRTMGCLRVHKLNEYLIDPIVKCLKDQDPYVRKSAILTIPKLYSTSPELLIEHKAIDTLQELLQKETNSMVLSNLVISLKEISNLQGVQLIKLNRTCVKKLLTTINECHEWGQIEILDCISQYVPEDTQQTEEIIERVLPRLSHINVAVAFGAVKIILKYINYLNDQEIIQHLYDKLKPSLISLISQSCNESKFVILKNMPHILQMKRNLLDKDIKCFFCQYNEPYYIKKEKLALLEHITNEKNVDTVLSELKEYIQEIDIEFVRSSMKILTVLCIKYSQIVDKVIDIFVDQIKTIENHGDQQGISQEIIIQMQKIYRKYQQKYNQSDALNCLMRIIDLAVENEATSAAAWIIGEYAEKIPQSIDYIDKKSLTFLDQCRQTQLELLTAGVKIFLKYCDESQEIIFRLLQEGAYKSENPDVRDRAYIYWNMLSVDAQYATQTVLHEKPQIKEKEVIYDRDFLEDMVDNLGNINTIYHKLQVQMFTKQKKIQTQGKPMIIETEKAKKQESSNNNQKNNDLLDDPFDMGGSSQQQPQQQQQQQQQIQQSDNLLDLDMAPISQPVQTPQNQFFQQNEAKQVPLEEVLSNFSQGKNMQSGLNVKAAVNLENNQITLNLAVGNMSNTIINEIQIQCKQNVFGLNITQQQSNVNIMQQQTQNYKYTLTNQNHFQDEEFNVPYMLVLGFKTNLDVFYFQIPIMIHTLLQPDSKLTMQDFQQLWNNLPDNIIKIQNIPINLLNQEAMTRHLEANRIYVITSQNNQFQNNFLNLIASTRINNQNVFLEIKLENNNAAINVKSPFNKVIRNVQHALQFIFRP